MKRNGLRYRSQTRARERRGEEFEADDDGFTFLETLIVLFLTGLFLTISMPYGLHFLSFQRLLHSREGLLYDLRYSQQAAQTLGVYARVQLFPWRPEYSVYSGIREVGHHKFDSGVNYRDGYLQLTTSTILYDQLGNAQVAGTIRLVDGREEAEVSLYMGTGLTVAKDRLP